MNGGRYAVSWSDASPLVGFLGGVRLVRANLDTYTDERSVAAAGKQVTYVEARPAALRFGRNRLRFDNFIRDAHVV